MTFLSPLILYCSSILLSLRKWDDLFRLLSGGILTKLTIGNRHVSSLCSKGFQGQVSVTARQDVLLRRRLHFDGEYSRSRPRTGNGNNSISCVEYNSSSRLHNGFVKLSWDFHDWPRVKSHQMLNIFRRSAESSERRDITISDYVRQLESVQYCVITSTIWYSKLWHWSPICVGHRFVMSGAKNRPVSLSVCQKTGVEVGTILQSGALGMPRLSVTMSQRTICQSVTN